MAKTYLWSDVSGIVKRMAKSIGQYDANAIMAADMTSSEMWIDYPWKDAIANTAKGSIPLIDSRQDYSANAPNISQLLKASLVRTDTTPHEHRDLDVRDDLSVDLYPRSWYAIRAASLQQAVGQFRLEAAVNLPTGMQIEFRCDYKIEPQKVTNLGDSCWFTDKYASVAVEGMLYWAYKLADDARAGSVSTDASGHMVGYTGQMAAFRGALNRMKNAEDYGSTQGLFPDDIMGAGRDQNSQSIFGW